MLSFIVERLPELAQLVYLELSLEGLVQHRVAVGRRQEVANLPRRHIRIVIQSLGFRV